MKKITSFFTLLLCFCIYGYGQEITRLPLSKALDANGKIKTGIEGSYGGEGYKMEYGRNGESAFRKAVTPNEINTITWSALGSSVNSSVLAIAVSGSDVYVGGVFTTAGDSSANYIAKWNGSTWSALGSGVNNHVYAIAVSGSDVYVGGAFTAAGDSSANYIAKWNGSAWSALGSGVNSPVFAIAVSGSDVYAGGYFDTAGGSFAPWIAKWDGSAWSALGSGLDNYVNAIAVSGSDVYVGGVFSLAGESSASYIAKWNGSAWSALGSGMDKNVNAIAVSGSDVYVGGAFTTAGDSSANHIAKWNGSTWSALGSGVNSDVYTIAVSGSDAYVGGEFTTAGDSSADFIAKWNGSAWSALGPGTSSIVQALAVNPGAGAMMVGGSFGEAGGISAICIAEFTDSDNPLAIELSNFGARINGSSVLLNWQTATETNNYGFYVERRQDSTGIFSTVSDLIPGHGTTLEEHNYQWTDTKVTNGNYSYRLRLVDLGGTNTYSNAITVTVSGVLGVGDTKSLPKEFALRQNYPNPFNPSTVINYELPRAVYVRLVVYDMLGREVSTLVNGGQDPGYKSVQFSATNLPSGIYTYRLTAGTFVEVKKMLMIK